MNIQISFTYIHQRFTFCTICPIYVPMQFFPYPWKVSCRHANALALKTLALLPKTKDVLPHHHPLSHPRNLTWIIMILPNILSVIKLPPLSPKCPYVFQSPGFNQGSIIYIQFEYLLFFTIAIVLEHMLLYKHSSQTLKLTEAIDIITVNVRIKKIYIYLASGS